MCCLSGLSGLKIKVFPPSFAYISSACLAPPPVYVYREYVFLSSFQLHVGSMVLDTSLQQPRAMPGLLSWGCPAPALPLLSASAAFRTGAMSRSLFVVWLAANGALCSIPAFSLALPCNWPALAAAA